jgi:hypothetical protein
MIFKKEQFQKEILQNDWANFFAKINDRYKSEFEVKRFKILISFFLLRSFRIHLVII